MVCARSSIQNPACHVLDPIEMSHCLYSVLPREGKIISHVIGYRTETKKNLFDRNIKQQFSLKYSKCQKSFLDIHRFFLPHNFHIFCVYDTIASHLPPPLSLPGSRFTFFLQSLIFFPSRDSHKNRNCSKFLKKKKKKAYFFLFENIPQTVLELVTIAW